MYVPEFVALYEVIPYIRNLPLNNETIRDSVKDYLEGGEKKDAIIKKYGKIKDWNTSEVTDMSCLFRGFNFDNSEHTVMRNFNEDITKWDTSKVTDMKWMFRCAKNFNQPIGRWCTSKVTNMEYMFCCAGSFNQPIGEWNVSKVTRMYRIFWFIDNFNPVNAPWCYVSYSYSDDE